MENEREAQLQDLEYRLGATISEAKYPISPSQDEVGALAYEEKGIHPRNPAPNEPNRGLGGPTKKGMGGAKPADNNTAKSGMKHAPQGIAFIGRSKK